MRKTCEEKNNILQNCSMRNCLELQLLVDNFRIMFIDAFLPEIYYLIKRIGDLDLKKTFC